MNNAVKKIFGFFLLCFVLSFSSQAAYFPPKPSPFHYVNDYTKTLTAAETQTLENKLIHYGQQTSSQIAVVLVPTTNEYEIAEYTFALGDKWGIGRKELNNGVLMLIAKNDRKVFIATGQGLEAVLPDAFLSSVIRNAILPQFKQEQYAQGISDGLDAIIAASQGEYGAYQAEEESTFDQYIPLLMILVFFAFVAFGEYQYHKNEVYVSPSQRDQLEQIIRQVGRSRHNNNGDGFGGGSSGGGFGGGGFGGGGAGGSW